MPQAFLCRFLAHPAGLWNVDTLLHCPFEHPTLECLNKEFFFSILKSVQVSVLVFNNQPMLVLESIVSYKMCIVTSRDDSSSIQCFLFTLVFAPCIILALKYGKVLIQTDKISGTAFHGIKSFPKLLNFYILTEKSICVTAHCLLFHMSLFSMARKILILFLLFWSVPSEHQQHNFVKTIWALLRRGFYLLSLDLHGLFSQILHC